MSNNEEIVNHSYHILVKELIEKREFLFDHVKDNDDFLGRLVYVFVSLFGEHSTNKNHVAALIRIIAEDFYSLDVDGEELYNTIVQFKVEMEQSQHENGGSAGSLTDVDDGKAGYVYVVINPSMNGLVKIGYTTREPKIRVTELSKHSGIPTPFVLVYQAFFDDCIRVEEEIHALLESQGFRVAGNREFFNVPVDEAVKVVQDFKEET